MPKDAAKLDAKRAAELFAKHGTLAGAAAEAGCTPKVVRKWLARSDGAAPAATPGGVALAGLEVSNAPRADVLKALIYGLGKGRAYPVAELAEQWGRSPETIRGHARRFGACKYVQLSPGNWVPCVLHPETAAHYKGA